jgi:ABC-type oligopeptide transport system substrate-binding subunit
MRKRLVLTALLAVAGASLLVTSAFAHATKAQKGGTLRVNQTLSDFEYIDPQKCYDTGCAEMLWPTSYNLMQYPEKNGAAGKRVYPEAATGMPTVSKDGKTYVFTLKAGHKASNGKVVTAQWFLHAWERLLSPKMGDAASARFGGISNFAAVQGAQAFYDGKAGSISGITASGNKLTIKLTKPFPALLSALAMNWFTATDPSTPYSDNDATKVTGAGPYYVSSRQVGQNLVLDRNKFYKGSRPANPDRIVYTVNVDENQSILQLKSGQADYSGQGGVPSATAAQLGDQYGVNKKQFWVLPTSVTSYWALNSLPSSPLGNVKLRQAINWAIDRPAQVRIAGKYAGRRTDQILPPAMPGFIANNSLYAYRGANLKKAKAVEGNVSNVGTIHIVHSNSQANINRGQVMRYNLEQIGLKATTEAIRSSQLFSRAGDKKGGNYDILAIGWQADYPDPRNFINVLLDGRQIPEDGSSNNAAFFNSPKFNKLMDQADKLSGQARFNAYGKLDHQIMKEGAPWAPYINANNRFLVSSRVKNFTYNQANTSTALNALVVQ